MLRPRRADHGFGDRASRRRTIDQLGLGTTCDNVSPRLTRTERLQSASKAALPCGANAIQTHGSGYALICGIFAGQGC